MNDFHPLPESLSQISLALSESFGAHQFMASSVAQVIQNILTMSDPVIVSGEIIARVQGMLRGFVHQMMDGWCHNLSHQDNDCIRQSLYTAMLQVPDIINFLHGIALEWQLIERVYQEAGVDPILPTIVQCETLESGGNSQLVSQFIASQARFTQEQQQMRLDIHDLPLNLFHLALASMRKTILHIKPIAENLFSKAEANFRLQYDESLGRESLTKALIHDYTRRNVSLANVKSVGVPLFIRFLSEKTDVSLHDIVLATIHGQGPRFAILQHAASLPVQDIQQNMMLIHPNAVMKFDLEQLRPAEAYALIKSRDNLEQL